MHGLHAIRSIEPRRAGRVRLPLGLAIVCVVVAGACTSASSTGGGGAASGGGSQAPSAPTRFTATWQRDVVACPSMSADYEATCHGVDFAWQSTSGADTRFRIYDGWTGEGDPMPTCADITPAEINQLLETEPGATAAQYFAERSIGGGQQCFWISAFNAVGESALVPAEATGELG